MTDLERRLAIVLDLAAAAVELGDENEWWAAVAVAVLGPLFHAEVMAVNMFDVRGRRGWFSVVHPVEARTRLPVNSSMHEILTHDHPFSTRLAQGPVSQPLKVTDLISERRWRNLASYDKMRELTGGAHHLTLHFDTPGDWQESLSLVRSEGDYAPDEMRLAAQLQAVIGVSLSHLRTVARRNQGRIAADLAAAHNSARFLGVTERERAVLELLDAGLSTGAVGRQLGIAPRTVYKHQENLYRKLGVTDRVNALRQARRQLLLPSVP